MSAVVSLSDERPVTGSRRGSPRRSAGSCQVRAPAFHTRRGTGLQGRRGCGLRTSKHRRLGAIALVRADTLPARGKRQDGPRRRRPDMRPWRVMRTVSPRSTSSRIWGKRVLAFEARISRMRLTISIGRCDWSKPYRKWDDAVERRIVPRVGGAACGTRIRLPGRRGDPSRAKLSAATSRKREHRRRP